MRQLRNRKRRESRKPLGAVEYTPPPVVYRFEPDKKIDRRTMRVFSEETWEQYITRICTYFNLSVFERTTAINNFNKYVKDGVDKSCAGYMVLRESGLYAKMVAQVNELRPHRKIQT